jgi:hypothetical protein
LLCFLVAAFCCIALHFVAPLLTWNSLELTSPEPLCSLEFLLLKKCYTRQ